MLFILRVVLIYMYIYIVDSANIVELKEKHFFPDIIVVSSIDIYFSSIDIYLKTFLYFRFDAGQVHPLQPLAFFYIYERSDERRVLPINPHSKIRCLSNKCVCK